MCDELLELWAKKTDGQAPSHYPLLFHMIDVAAVTEQLWEAVLQASTRSFFAEQLGLNEGNAKRWVAFWAGLHDLGKATPAFQSKSNDAKARLQRLGFDFGLNYDEVHHGTATTCILHGLLESEFSLSKELSRRVASAVGGHHGIFPKSEELRRPSRLANKKWREQWLKLAKTVAECCEISGVPAPACLPQNGFFILLAGLTAVADWVASNENWFPYYTACPHTDKHFAYAKLRAQQALQSLLWECPLPGSAATFTRCFDFSQPRPLQQEAVRLASELQGQRGLVIIEAPMGEGKTEAALYLADSWLASLKQKGVYFALPSQATSNQMFGRVKSFLERRFAEDRVGLMLLHGHASLNSEFNQLVQRVRFTDVDADSALAHNTYDRAPSTVAAAEWFTYRKRGLLAPFGVGTVDQALLSVLQTRHYFVRLFGLAGKTVIIDEVHAYDAYMMTLLERLVEWLAALGTTVVVLSATLPAARRNALLAAYYRGSGKGGEAVMPSTPSLSYPRISWVADGKLGGRTITVSPQSTKEVRIKWVDSSAAAGDVSQLGRQLNEVLADGGCAAVICNTVDRAQALYRQLKGYFPGVAEDGELELDLFHARYPFVERQRRERRTLIRFGKEGSTIDCGDEGLRKVYRPRRAVLVATQVVEQSLDLDFDLMVTEMAPIDLILQRAGRLQRHQHPRPPVFRNRPPELWILKPQFDDRGCPVFGSGTEKVYDRHILLRSWLLLKEEKCVKIPDDVERLIEMVYDGDWQGNLPQALQEEWHKTLEELTRRRREYSDLAKDNSLPSPAFPDDILETSNRDLEEDNPEVHLSLRALTRVAEEPSVQVLCLYGSADSPKLSPETDEVLDIHAQPSEIVVRRLLERSLNISHRGVADSILKEGRQVDEKWRHAPLLRHHYMLFFDSNHRCRIGSYKLCLDSELGLTIEKR